MLKPEIMIAKIIPSTYEPLDNIKFDQTLARIGHINKLIDEINLLGASLPTSAVGLPSGALWNNLGVVSIAP